MKIVNECVNTVQFDSIEIGTVFKYYDNYYVKIDWLDSRYYGGNAFALSDMVLTEVSSVEEVIPCKVELRIIKEGIND